MQVVSDTHTNHASLIHHCNKIDTYVNPFKPSAVKLLHFKVFRVPYWSNLHF